MQGQTSSQQTKDFKGIYNSFHHGEFDVHAPNLIASVYARSNDFLEDKLIDVKLRQVLRGGKGD